MFSRDVRLETYDPELAKAIAAEAAARRITSS